jgi:GNAT superfamily N-acetyltransferase
MLDLRSTETALIADRHTFAVQGWLSSRTPSAVSFDGHGIKVRSTGLGVPLLNLALGANFININDADIQSEIEAVKTFFAARRVPWYWWISPFSSPADIGARLEASGARYDPPDLSAMVAPLPPRKTEVNPDLRVWQAGTRADLEAASYIRRVAFKFPSGVGANYFEDMAEDWLRGDPAHLYLAAVNNGPPAAIGAWIVAEGVPGVYAMATLPEWRQRGLGRAILQSLLADAAADGHQMIVLTASNMGEPLYRQFGFERVFGYLFYLPEQTGKDAGAYIDD